MSYILAENLSKSFGERVILQNISFSVEPGQKVALVARNGTGKSTLLKIITGKESYDSGKLSMQKGIKTEFLEQEPHLNPSHTIMEEIFTASSPLISAVRMYEESLQNPNDVEKAGVAIEAMNEHNAWEYETKIKEVLEKLKLTHLIGKIETLSGGQKKKVALAKVLLDNPDFLIMDEPTNHLDLDMIDWLEEYLTEKQITLFLVTHDRYFLERVCDHIFELDNGKLYKYEGNYSYFLEKKAEREYNTNLSIDKTKSLLRRELEWVRKQPRGRQAKSTARVDSYYETKRNLKEKIVVEKVKLDVVGKKLGTKVLEIHNLSKSFNDKKILDKFTYTFVRGEKIGIIGKNGVGKTTFLKLIMEQEQPDSGNIVKGQTVDFGYYSQSGLDLKDNEKVIDAVKNIAPYIKLSNGYEISASQMLERFLFTPLMQQVMVGKLSGGEKRRIYLLRILMKNPNFLILDEPTNDLDIMTLQVLEDFLLEFKGCLIVISHDRYFIDKIVDHLLVFEGEGKVKNFPGNYSVYRQSVKEENGEIGKGIDTQRRDSSRRKDLSRRTESSHDQNLSQSNEAKSLLKEIQRLEKRRDAIHKKFLDASITLDEMHKYNQELKEIEKLIEKTTEEWLIISV